MQRINWNDIQDFLTIARAGRLARAGTLAGVDATTIARRLRRLERRLGQTLFEQTRDGLVLTAAGEKLQIQAEAMQIAADRIADTPDDGRALTGLLRVSASEGFGTWYIAHRLRDFAASYPRLVIDLVASSGFLNPSKRETDIAIMLSRPTSGPLVGSKLTDYDLGIYAARSYLEHHEAPRTREDLARHDRLVGYVPELLYAPQLNYIDELNPTLEATIRSTSINGQYRLIASGCGIGALPHFIARTDDTLVRLMPEIMIRRSFWMVAHRDTRELRRVREFQAWLTAGVKRDRRWFLIDG
ncbi:MAG: LysR family transcriptional regulator [Sphingomonas sp.]|uniref:LysR family transcriptional regulator n=1 Tax=Sphingomonas sp. TaxID=28214 RepID=UPI003F817DF2